MAELTKDTARKSFNEAGKSISICENHVDRSATLLSELESKPKTDEVNALIGIAKISLIIDFINLDLCAALRQYLSSELSTKYDKRQAMTKINIVMSEGYKKIYGFENKQREKSYWANQIKTVVDFIGGFDKEYKELETKLVDFGKNGSLNKDMRDLAVHYDSDPMKVYCMLSELDAEEITRSCKKFYDLINSITKFVWQLSNKMMSKLSRIQLSQRRGI